MDLLQARQGDVCVRFDNRAATWNLRIRPENNASESVRSLADSKWKHNGKVYASLGSKTGLTAHGVDQDGETSQRNLYRNSAATADISIMEGDQGFNPALGDNVRFVRDGLLLSVSEPDVKGDRTVYSLVNLSGDSEWGFATSKSRGITIKDTALQEADVALPRAVFSIFRASDPYELYKTEILIPDSIASLGGTVIGGSDAPIECYQTDFTALVPVDAPTTGHAVPILLQDISITAIGHRLHGISSGMEHIAERLDERRSCRLLLATEHP